jgi:hypothetical protein
MRDKGITVEHLERGISASLRIASSICFLKNPSF